jgi:hypothetical protein
LVDAADYVLWRKNFGSSAGAASAISPVPEISAFWLVIQATIVTTAYARAVRTRRASKTTAHI